MRVRKYLSNENVSDDITWHAGPFNLEVETMDQDLFDFSMELSTALDVQVNHFAIITSWFLVLTYQDTQFGKEPKTVFSLKDVPGMTRGAVPVLAKRGVQLIHVGVNDETSPPAVRKDQQEYEALCSQDETQADPLNQSFGRRLERLRWVRSVARSCGAICPVAKRSSMPTVKATLAAVGLPK